MDGALSRGDLRYAIKLAEELRVERGKPIPLDVAARFLPLIAAESPNEYDAWAVRWLARWLTETAAPTIDQAVDVATGLAAVPIEPEAIEPVRAACRPGLGVSGA